MRYCLECYIVMVNEQSHHAFGDKRALSIAVSPPAVCDQL